MKNAAPFADRYGPWAVVLGASEGIGRAWALALAERKLSIVLVARRPEPLAATADEVRALGVQAEVVSLDLASPSATAELARALGAREVGFVVYNACYSKIGPYLDMTGAERETTVMVNVQAPMDVADHFGRQMQERGRGALVFMSSMSGFQGTELIGAYAASKAFMTTLAESLWAELEPTGVQVLACVAGATRTPNFERATPADKQDGTFPQLPEEVVADGLRALARGHGPTVVTGKINRLAYHVVRRFLSRAIAVRFLSGQTKALYAKEG